MGDQQLGSKIYFYPTDTIWGVGAYWEDKNGIDLISAAKGRDDRSPYSLLFSNFEEIKNFVDIDNLKYSKVLKKIFMLQSSLLIPVEFLKQKSLLPILKGSSYVGVRCMDGLLINSYLKELKFPITSTSVNMSGQIPLNDYKSVKEFAQKHFKDFTIVEYMGPMGTSGSTIVALDSDEYKIIRMGLKLEEIKKILDGI